MSESGYNVPMVFPSGPHSMRGEGGEYIGEITKFGLSLRDYFAAKAMGKMCNVAAFPIREDDCSQVAEYAYKMADAMLARRNAKP